MDLPGYIVDSELHRGRKRVVYRARRGSDGASLILKAFADEFPSPADTASLRREYQILQSLPLPGSARPLALETYRDRVILVLEDCGDTTLKALVAEGALDVGPALSIAHQLASTLADVHRAGVVHKDVSASNVIVDRATMRATIADFGIASRAGSEPQRLGLPHLIEGTLAYMSPEQTGRMNRDLDYRSDLYSLGVVCYELLTGRLPFESADPLELIHAHVAQMPVPPAERDPRIPQALSAVVMKLLAKNAEERYQSGEGVAADLARCLAGWEASGWIAPFHLAQDDVRDRFVISQRLYGRQSEVASLHDAFERAAAGQTELVLVSGYSGIGKTSLVQETYRSLAQRPGHYAAGKFDLLARDVPYKALAQAFQDLMRDLLSDTEDRVESWRSRLREALGENGQVIVDVIPDLARLIGSQPPVPPLGAVESQNRFNLVFQRFLGTLARPQHPLVLFIDDLQWADSATLSLLPLFLTNPDLRGLLVICAYRDNEVSPSHPLSQVIRDLASRGRLPTELVLSPLAGEHLSRLLSDTLAGAAEEVIGALSTLVLAKTGGNPFFVTQFLKSLHQDAHIAFDRPTRSWRVDLAAIRSLQMTENVVDLMSGRIQRLEESTQRVLRLAACVGNRFDLGTLATVSEQEPARCVAELWPAVEQGLVLQEQQSYGFPPNPADGRPLEQQRFRFLHDRVQQAAYTLIPEAARKAVHLMVGRQLAGDGGCETSESIFDVVNHLNYGSELITAPAERQRLAELNLAAGKRAKASAAYPSALSYFAMGTALLADGAWTAAYPLALALHRERAEAQYLCGQFPEAEASFNALLDRCRSPLDRADVAVLLIVQFENMSRYGDAIRVGLDALRSLGVDIPSDPAALQPALARELEAIRHRLDGRAVASLLELPRLADPSLRQTMKLLLALWAPSYITCFGELRDLSAARMVRLSLEHGNCEESAYGYLGHAVTVGSVLGDYERGHEFGELALALNERLADMRLRAVVHHRFAALVNLWRRPFATCLPYAREAVRAGFESGNLHVAGYAQFQQSWYGMMIERDLTAFQERYASSVDVLAQLQNPGFLQMQRLILQWGRALQGQTETPTTLTGPDFDEAGFLRTFGQGGIFRGLWATLKLELLDTFGYVEAARILVRDEEPVAEQFTGSIWPALFAFRHVLALCAWLPGAPASERSAAEAKLDGLAARLKCWADNAPENFGHFHLLASAEIARVRSRAAEAVTLYEAAIDDAVRLDSPRHRALANELYGRFWFERRHPQIARGFLSEARYGYAAWGATAKVAELDRHYQDLLRERTGLPSDPAAAPVLGTTQTLGSALDAIAVARAAQAISREIELDKLLEQLLRVALEGAGAERGSLLLERDEGEPAVFVEGTVAGIHVRAEQSDTCPLPFQRTRTEPTR